MLLAEVVERAAECWASRGGEGWSDWCWSRALGIVRLTLVVVRCPSTSSVLLYHLGRPTILMTWPEILCLLNIVARDWPRLNLLLSLGVHGSHASVVRPLLLNRWSLSILRLRAQIVLRLLEHLALSVVQVHHLLVLLQALEHVLIIVIF